MSARTCFIILAFLVSAQVAGAAVIQLPRTGQTTCWDTAGNVIPCAGTGQDGETLYGVEWPSPRFNDNGDGTLTDRLTGLVWLREANCFGSVPWQQGLDSANALASGACGLSDGSVAGEWRLPNRKELLSITNQNVSDGGAWLNSQGFVHGQHTYYWTSDTCLDYGVVYKWIVHPVGAAYPDSWNTPSGSRFVMLVRDPAQVTITAAVEGGHGTIASANPLTGAFGSAATFVLSPELGYLVNPAATGTCQPGSFSGNVYDLGKATADCSVSFSFAPITHTISTSTSGSGGIACIPSGAVPYNADASCTATPATGSHVEAVTVDGVDQTVTDPASFTYPFPAMITDHNMFAAFAMNSYTVNFLAGSHGFLTGSASQTVSHGGSTTAVTAFSSTGYHFVNWTGDNGFAATTANPLTITNVIGSLTVTGNFAIDSYLVTPGSAANGSIAPATPQAVSYNDVTSFTLTPDVGYRVAEVNGCGGTLTGSTYTTGPVTGNCSVSFSFTPITYTIAVSTSGSGSIQCTPGSTVTYNGAASCTARAQSGNHIADVTVDGAEQAVTDPRSFTYPFAEVTADHAMGAVFTINSYTVTFAAGSNGTITGSASQNVTQGSDCTPVTAVPATGYHLVNWTGNNGFAATAVNPLTVTNVTAAQEIVANFGIDTHVVTPGAAVNGSVAPATPQTVSYNGTSSFAITPDVGYRISSVTGCGGTLNGSIYTTAPVTSDCSVSASFTPITYTVRFAAGTNGTLAGVASQVVNQGGSSTAVSGVPSAGYHFVNWTGDNGFAATSANPLVVAGVTRDQSVTANFAIDTHVVSTAATAHGGIAPAASQSVSHNDLASFTITPDTGYQIASVTGCGGTLNGASYTTAPVTSDCSVSASFTLITFVISGACADDKGAISCPQTANYGGGAVCTLSPRAGFRLATLTDNSADCLPLVTNNSYAIANVTAGHSVVASFTANSYAIGDILKAYKSVLGQQQLSEGEKATFDVAPLGGDGRPLPDGKIDLADLVLLLRQMVGAVRW